MNTAIQNRNNSFKELNLPKKLRETLQVIRNHGPLSSREAKKYFQDNREIISVASRFTDLRNRGFIRLTDYSYVNPRTNKKCAMYVEMTKDESLDYSRVAGQAWSQRISELENELYGCNLSIATCNILKEEIKKHKNLIKNLRNI
tara:strand:+ start:2860 stop:3294 length:435 start_codon:yes stop_codon:yes gene_type:complete